MLCFTLVAIFSVGMLSLTAATGSRLLDRPVAVSMGFELERTFAATAKLRTRIEVSEVLEIGDGAENRHLRIKIWIPYSSWDSTTLENIVITYAAFAPLAEEFDYVLMNFWTEIRIGLIAWLPSSAETRINLKSPDFQFALAAMHLTGAGLPKDDVQAAKWFRKAAKKGHADSQFALAAMHQEGAGVPKDYVQAANWFRKAAKQGHADSQFALATMYEEGAGVPKDDVQAAKWFRKAAEQGHAVSQYQLGFAHLRGIGVEPDPREAAHWWRKAAEQGHAAAQYVYGYLYSKGVGVSLSLEDAVAWYQKAAEHGDSWARYALGSHYLLGAGVVQDSEDAAKWFQLVAGDDEYAGAAESFARAAETGEDDAEFFLGMMHRYGHGMPVDDAKAIEWFRKAADKGYVVAKVPLGEMQN